MHLFEYYRQLEGIFGWSEADARRVESLGPWLAPYLEDLVDDFCGQITRRQRLAEGLADGQSIGFLKQTLQGWLVELFSGRYDEQYVACCWNLGERYVELRPDRLHTNGGLSRLRRGLWESLAAAGYGASAAQIASGDSLHTLLDLNLAIVARVYQGEFERRQATAERLATIGMVAGSVVEELRGPLEVAKQAIGSLQVSPAAVQAIGRVELERLDRQVWRAELIVSKLNDFTRLPLDEFQPVEMVQCLRDAFDAHDLADSVHVRWDLPVARLNVLGDPAQLRIVLSNLICSAQDALQTGGLLHLGACSEGDLVCITIQHTRLCNCHASERAARAMAGTASDDRKPRIGLELSILHDIVGRHRGALHIATQDDLGTTATLRLPVHR